MEFYLHFQQKHPKIIIGKRAFDGMHLFFVKTMKDQNVCCCIYHVELDKLQQGLNYMRTKFGVSS
jgi:hypothetical protein